MRQPLGRSEKERLDRIDSMVERLVARARKGQGDLRANASWLLDLAENFNADGQALRAFRLSRRAAALVPGDGELRARSRQLMGRLVPGYHLPMMNDHRRNVSWDQAFRQVVRPGMKALEIGTGAGMLALMAARAGAQVVTCEYHEIVAAIAREILECNGFGGQVTVLTKPSSELKVGEDLEERADLLFCDNFSDNFFSFEPLKSIADARKRLLKPGAPCVPAGGRVRLALASWTGYPRFFQAGQSCGFNIGPADGFRSESIDLEIFDPGISLLTEAQDVFVFDFGQESFPEAQQVEVELVALQDCTVHGVAQWIRLDLAGDIYVEARPEPGAVFFSNPRFHPLEGPRSLRAGESLRVVARHDHCSLALWTL